MRSVAILVALWLLVQFGGMLLKSRNASPEPPALSSNDVEKILKSWPSRSRGAAHSIIAEYGLPDRARPNLLRWEDGGIVLFCDSIRPDTVLAAGALNDRIRSPEPKRSRAKLLRAGS